jgi:hypothetical protein
MARQLNRLTARTIATCKNFGRHADGQNLYLKVSRTADGLSKSWVFMYVFAARHREAGLGSASAVTLAQAREKAAEYRSMLAKGIGPTGRKEGHHGSRGQAPDVRTMCG